MTLQFVQFQLLQMSQAVDESLGLPALLPMSEIAKPSTHFHYLSTSFPDFSLIHNDFSDPL